MAASYPNPWLTQEALRAKNRTKRADGLWAFPEMHTLSEKYLQMMEDLAERWTTALPAQVDELGFSGPNAIPRNFYGLRHVAGVPMNPTNLPPRSNAGIRDILDLTDDFESSRHARIFDELFSFMFSNRRISKLRMARDSSTGFPFFQTSPEFKIKRTTGLLQNAPRILDDLMHCSLEDMFEQYQFMISYYLNVRNQNGDEIVKNQDGSFTPKVRKVNTWAAAFKGDPGGYIEADRAVRLPNGRTIPDHFATRTRSVYGLSADPNMLIAAIMSGHRAHYLHEGAFTWEQRTPTDVENKVNRYEYCIGFDVAQFDQSLGPKMLHRFIDRLTDGLHPGIRKVFDLSTHAPYYSPAVETGTSKGIWMGNPFRADNFCLEYGLPSGVAYNPDYGKFIMTWVYLCLLDDRYRDVLEIGVRTILGGGHPRYALLDMGDDAVLLINDKAFHESLVAELKADRNPSPYVKLEWEKRLAFLGNVFYRDDSGRRALSPNLVSCALNLLCPERGITSRMRRFWPIGYFERQNYYSRAPSYGTYNTIFVDTVREHYGVSPDSIALVEQRKMREIVRAETWADRLVLEDPSKLYYRVNEEDLSQSLLDQLICYVPDNVVTNFIKAVGGQVN